MKDNEILKETLLHYINLEYYANGIYAEFQSLLSELESRCSEAILSQVSLNTKLSYNALMKTIKEEVEEYQKELEERLEEEAEYVLREELDFLDKTYNERGGINGTLLALGGVAASRLLFAPAVGNDTTKQFVERTGKNILRSYETPLRSGYLFGQKTEDINNQVSKNLKQVARGMQNGIRTAIPAYAKTTDRIVFLNNEVEVVWVATLDGRTCITCASMSGLRFKSVTEAPPVIHPLCRCQLLPVNEIKEPIPNYTEFLESLSDEEQYSVLGKNRYELYKAGYVKPEKFINNGQVVPLKDLQKDVDSQISKIVEKSKNILSKTFSNEEWIEKSQNLFVAKSREQFAKINKTETAKLAKEISQAKILTDRNIVSFLPSESGNGKHYDSLTNFVKTEFKTVTGSRDKVGDNFKEALKQGHDIFIRTNGISTKSAFSSILGKTKVLLEKGQAISSNRKVYFWDDQQKELHIWSLDEIIKIAKTLL